MLSNQFGKVKIDSIFGVDRHYARWICNLDIIQSRCYSGIRHRTHAPLPFSIFVLNSLLPKPRRYCRSSSSDSFLGKYTRQQSNNGIESESLATTKSTSATSSKKSQFLLPEPFQRQSVKRVTFLEPGKSPLLQAKYAKRCRKFKVRFRVPDKEKFRKTYTWVTRRSLNLKRIEAGDNRDGSLKVMRVPVVVDWRKIPHRRSRYKDNKASILRSKATAKKAVIPMYVTQHYNKFHKPPFKTNGAACRQMVKCVNTKLRR